MRSDDFITWLTSNRNCASHVARDIDSRCRRMEKAFGVDLDAALADQGGVASLIERMERESESYLRPSKNPQGAVDVLKRAVRLYREYLVAARPGNA